MSLIDLNLSKMKFIMKSVTLLAISVLPACQTPSIDIKENATSMAPVLPENDSTAINLLSKQDLPLRAVSIIEKLVAQNKIPAQYAAQFPPGKTGQFSSISTRTVKTLLKNVQWERRPHTAVRSRGCSGRQREYTAPA